MASPSCGSNREYELQGPSSDKGIEDDNCDNGQSPQANHHQFIDDKSGRKPIQSYCLRFALQVMEDQAHQSRQLVQQQLAESGDLKESQRVQVGATRHEKDIITRVRKRLRETMVPTAYLRTEDPCAANLYQLNQQRSREIQLNQKTLDKLENESKALTKETRKAKAEQRRLRKKEAQENRARGNQKVNNIHPLLEPFSHVEEGKSLGAEMPGPLTIGEINYRRAPKGTMAALLKKIQQ